MPFSPRIATIGAMIILDTSEESLRKAGAALASGLLVALPTETVYGLGADAFNPLAVAKVFEAKARPSFDPLIVHIARMEDLSRVAASVPPLAERLALALWPGPLTIILPKRPEVPDIVTSGLDTVAVRFPSHPVARRIIELSGTAVAAPSANPFGYISPTKAEHVARTLGGKIDFLVDGGPCAVGVESTVIDATKEIPELLRPGGMPLERIREIVGEIAVPPRFHGSESGPMASPGQLSSHYAPRSALRLFEFSSLCDAGIFPPQGRGAALVFDGERAAKLELSGRFDAVFALSEKGEMTEAAAALFALLHNLDFLEFDWIYAEKVPDEGLGRAIKDRLFRASRK
ncbi:MAG: tRNA threonylcarbamoyladenosine biosynthesis protein [Spirochaetes bacterium]|nr:MAG: tRNA threonylcarbamoyladenosine biosynthesis protein [Spirochaetota bacterium]